MKVESGPSGAKLKNTRKCEGLTSDEAARVLALMKDAKTESVAIDAIRPNPRNARRHPPKQIATLAENIRQFGFTVPVLADEHGEILAGHGRHAAKAGTEMAIAGPLCRRSQSPAVLTTGQMTANGMARPRVARRSFKTNERESCINVLGL